jgi:hypothetical protein
MSVPQKRRGPDARQRVEAGKQNYRERNCRTSTARLPANWRTRLPDPAAYYASHVARLSKPNATGWAQGSCPFHEDRNASLSVHVADERGGWRCFASCGGGDLLGFHMRRTGLAFADAVRDLIGGRAR